MKESGMYHMAADMKKAKQPLYMKRTLILIMMLGYMALLILLLVTSWYLIGEYQAENRRKESDVLESCIGEIQDAMYNIDRHIYDIYAYNDDFQKLSGILAPLENYQHAYSLRETLKNKLLLDEAAHGYFLYYDRLSQPWYSVNTGKIKSEDASRLNDTLKQFISTTGNMRSWQAVGSGADILLTISCRKENVAICAVHTLSGLTEELQEHIDKPIRVILLNDGSALTEKDLAAELGIKNQLGSSLNSYSGQTGQHYVYASRIEKTDLWVVMAVEYNFWSFMNVQQLLLLGITLVSVFAVVKLYDFLRKQFLHPLRELTGVMNQIRTGEIREVPVTDVRFRELRDVNETLRAMVAEIEKQKLLVYEEIIEKQKAQMQYLQLQLKPHFYLNGLKTLSALAAENERDSMQELIYNLGVHMRYLLQAERETVPLRQEVDFVRNYINLQVHMTGRRVRCDYQIDDEALSATVPMLCIQTFVENSVKYAKLGSSSIPLHITVSAAMLSAGGEHFLDITVADNGHGYSEAVLREINSDTSRGNENIGINNIKRRCRLLYGSKAEYRFSNDGGAVSELIIPGEVQA